MKRPVGAALILASVVAAASLAGPDTVRLPNDYQATFINYLDVDRFDRLGVRKMWVNPEAHAAAVAGDPLPMGTILIMAVQEAEVDADGNPVFDADGRLIAGEQAGHRFVMEKNADWQTANGNWDYAWYQPDDTPRPDAEFDGCFACHANRSGSDFNFTFSSYVTDKGK